MESDMTTLVLKDIQEGMKFDDITMINNESTIRRIIMMIADRWRVPEHKILSVKSWKKMAWDVLIIVLAVINSYLLPVNIAYGLEPVFSESTAYLIFMNGMDICFVIDMALMFFTSFIDIRGSEVFSSQLIASEYLGSKMFVFDFFGFFGSHFFYSISDAKFFAIFRFFKMLKLVKLNILITRLNVRHLTKMLIQILQLIIYMMIAHHQ